MTTDPVCEMSVQETKAAAIARHAGRTYYFCSAHCKVTFERAPESYLRAAVRVHEEDRFAHAPVTDTGA